MAPSYMLDTNICIHIRRRRPADVLDRFRALRSGEAVISVITYGELRVGAEKSASRERAVATLEEFVTLVQVQPLPQAAGIDYGAIRAELERGGEVIGNNDLWIAAHARTSNLVLVTSNEREFRRVPGLKVESWGASAS